MSDAQTPVVIVYHIFLSICVLIGACQARPIGVSVFVNEPKETIAVFTTIQPTLYVSGLVLGDKCVNLEMHTTTAAMLRYLVNLHLSLTNHPCHKGLAVVLSRMVKGNNHTNL